MSRITRRDLLAGAGALVAAPWSLASCRSAPAAASDGRKKVRLTYGLTSVAKTRGVFEATLREQGVDVDWSGPFPNHAPTCEAVATGTADFSFGGSSTPADQAILSGARLVFVAWSAYKPKTTSILVLPSSKINSVRDLVGKTVATNKAGVAEFVLVAALEKYGVPRDKVNVVYLNPPDALPAFASGKVDAWSIWQGPLQYAEVQFGAKRLFEHGKEFDKDIDYGTYLVREEYARKEADTIRKVIRAYQAEVEWTNQHGAESWALSNQVTKYPQAVVDRIVADGLKGHLSFMDDQGVALLQDGADWLAQHQVISGPIRIADHAVRL
jgi:sulfonate transport system substrate-binding protein